MICLNETSPKKVERHKGKLIQKEEFSDNVMEAYNMLSVKKQRIEWFKQNEEEDLSKCSLI